MTCPNCGLTNPDNARFCANCGTTLAGGAVPPYTPPQTQAPYPPPMPPPTSSIGKNIAIGCLVAVLLVILFGLSCTRACFGRRRYYRHYYSIIVPQISAPIPLHYKF